MVVIKKKISLEDFKSRMPSLCDCYDGNLELKFTDEIGVNSDYLEDNPNGNYGKYPKTIKMPYSTKNDVNNLSEKKINIVNYGELSGKNLSWYNISKIYHILDNYKIGLKNDTCLGRDYENYDELSQYNNATQEIESQISDYEFNYYGGNDSYNYMCENIFNKFIVPFGIEITVIPLGSLIPEKIKIPYESYDYWGTNSLHYTDIIKWYDWFVTNQNNNDCCIRDEYNNRGGDDMLKWLSSKKIYKPNVTYSKKTTFTIPLYIQNTIDNFGQCFSLMNNSNDEFFDDNLINNSNTTELSYTTTTNSKLNNFYSNKIIIDNLGNVMNGIYSHEYDNDGNIKWNPIKDNYQMWLPYEIGCIKNINKVNNQDFATCDILYKCEIWIKSIDQKFKLEDKYTNTFDFNNKIINIELNDGDKLYCKMYYRLNAMINDKGELQNQFSHIDYIDTYELIKKTQTYWYSESIQYNLWYYDLVPYGDTECKVYIFNNNENDKQKYFIFDNKLGIVSTEKIEGDIYVDRGSSSAFRNYIALQEVKTLEGLMQYGNNLFNIEEL